MLRTVLETDVLWRLLSTHAVAIEEEAHRVRGQALSLAVGVDDLLHERRLLDFEVHLGTVLRNHLQGGGVSVAHGTVLFCTAHGSGRWQFERRAATLMLS